MFDHLVDLSPLKNEEREKNTLRCLDPMSEQVAITLVLPEERNWDMAISVCDDARQFRNRFIASGKKKKQSFGMISKRPPLQSTAGEKSKAEVPKERTAEKRTNWECSMAEKDYLFCKTSRSDACDKTARFPFISRDPNICVKLDQLFAYNHGAVDTENKREGDEYGDPDGDKEKFLEVSCKVVHPASGKVGHIFLNMCGLLYWDNHIVSVCDKAREYWQVIWKWQENNDN